MFVIPSLDTSLGACKNILIHLAPGMPPDIWWVTAVVLFILVLAATIDAFTNVVPDILILCGMLAITGMQAWYASWQIAAKHLCQAIEAGLLIWFVNRLWYLKFRNDALGMGDAKWTMLAVACFGVMPALIAWGMGAWLAIIWLGGAWLAKCPRAQVSFAPFLMVGLAIGLYWLRVRA